MFFDEPTYLIQFGFNGQTVVQRALANDHTDGVVFSPTDYSYEKSDALAETVGDSDRLVLCDPQFYIPRTDKAAAATYPYFEQSGGDNFETVVVTERNSREQLCEQILDVQDTIGVDAYISPARYLDSVSDRKITNWVELQDSFIELAENRDPDIPIFTSLPVDGSSLTSDDALEKLLDRATGLQPDGFYISVQFDRYRNYPLHGANQVRAYLELLKYIRYNHFDVLLGHSHQIAHLAFGLGINAFASGHFQNTKAFHVDRWIPEDEGFGQGGVYYYYSDAILNELRTEQGLQNLYNNPSYDENRIRMDGSPYEGGLFTIGPEDATWKMSEAEWDHYVWACYQISRDYRGKSLTERAKHAEYTVRGAGHLYDEIKRKVAPQDNVVEEIFDDWLTAYLSVQSKPYLDEVERMLQ